MLIQEFYSNMHGFDYSVSLFATHIQGTGIVVTPDIVSDMLHVLTTLAVIILRSCLKTSLYPLFVSIPLIGVIVSSLLVRPLLKVLGLLTWL